MVMLRPFRTIIDEHCRENRLSKTKLMKGNRSKQFTRLRTAISREAFQLGYTKTEIAYHLRLSRSSVYYHFRAGIKMSENSSIEWTDHTFNAWRGCTKVSEGCANCYAERDSKRFPIIRGIWGPNGTRVVTSEQSWKEPLKWNRKAKEAGERYRVFCASLADVFEDWQGPMHDHHGTELDALHWEGRLGNSDADVELCKVPLTMDTVRRRLFELIDATPYLDWLIVTKRPENIRKMTYDYWTYKVPGRVSQNYGDGRHWKRRKNVWLLTSVEDQEQADKRIPELLKCRDLSPVLGLSMEPLLGPVDLVQCCWTPDRTGFRNVLTGQLSAKAKFRNGQEGWVATTALDPLPHVDWVIVGGESGHNARPMHPDWVRSIRDQCVAAGVPFFFKQRGEWHPLHGTGIPTTREEEEIEPFTWISLDGSLSRSGCEPDRVTVKVGKKTAGRLLDGVEWSQFPEVQR